jgi:hypothetical protein
VRVVKLPRQTTLRLAQLVALARGAALTAEQAREVAALLENQWRTAVQTELVARRITAPAGTTPHFDIDAGTISFLPGA